MSISIHSATQSSVQLRESMITDRHIPQLSFSQRGRRFSYFITPQFHNQQLQDVQKVVLTISKLMLNSEIPIKHGALFLHQNMCFLDRTYTVLACEHTIRRGVFFATQAS